MEIIRTHQCCAPRFDAQRVLRVSFGLCLLGLAGWATNQAHAEPPDVSRYQVYELKYKDVSEAETVLTEMLEGFTESVDLVADKKLNRILLSGPEKAHRIAAKVLKSIDQAPAETKPPAAESIVKSYPCPKAKLNTAIAKLRDRYSDTNGVRIAGDAAGERLLIFAPPDIHTEIRSLFGGSDEPSDESPKPQRPATSRPQAQPAKTAEIPSSRRKATPLPLELGPEARTMPAGNSASDDGQRFVELLHVHTDVVAPYLRKLLGSRFEAIGSAKTEYRVTAIRGSSLDLTIDRKRNGIRLVGDPVLTGQLASIVQSLDDPTGTGNELTRVLPLRGINPDKVHEVQGAFRLEARKSAPARGKAKPDLLQSRRSSVSHADYVTDQEQLSTIRLMGNQESSQVPTNDGAADQPADEMQDATQPPRKPLSELEVEVLPDLDVVILRGKKSDVQEMTRLLKELERLSLETEPKVEIYPLKHVRGESLAVLIEKVNTDLTGGLRGKITITPLVKPNALLIIGWGETVASVKLLIEQLDQPVPPDGQFQIFRLKYADATPARTTIQEFFTARTPAGTGTGTGTGAATGPGLAPRVQVTADTRTNSLIVQAPPRDLQEAAELIKQLDVPGGATVHQARIFKLKNTLAADITIVLQSAIDAAGGKAGTGAGTAGTSHKSSMLEFLAVDKEGQQVLKSGMLGDVKITADTHTNSLLVSATPESMELIAALIRKLDESTNEGAQIKVFRVVNGDSTSLVQMLRSLLPPPGPAGSTQLANSRDESSLVPTRFSVDLRTNSIIATGSAGDLRIVEALLFRLDQKDIEQRKNTVYRLKNAPSADVAKSVNDFLRSERIVQQAAPGAISPFQQIESEVVVVSEPVSNSLIISATPRFFDEILVLVEKLDAQPPQVMIQCMIAQITLNNTNEFGVELGLQDSLLFDRSLLSNLVTSPANTQTVSTPSGIVTSTVSNIVGAALTPGFAFNGQPLGNSGSQNSLNTAANVAGQATSNFGVGTTNQTLGYGGLVLSASSENVSVLLRALQQSSRLEVLSRPLIRTLDNQPAFIQIGQRVPRIVTASVTQVGSVNGVVLENVGLILGVTPRISPDGMVVMEVDAENSSVDVVDPGIPVSVSASGTVIRSPIFNITTASTTVSANSGETIIIGGLIVKSTNESKRRVPLLSDVPVLGNFFRYDSSIIQRSELLIILTPYVIRTPEESARIKAEEVARMHWCAGDVVDLYGPGIISEERAPFAESNVPVIYPDLNPRGTIQAPEIPPEPQEASDAVRGQINGDAENPTPAKSKKSGYFPLFSQKKSK